LFEYFLIVTNFLTGAVLPDNRRTALFVLDRATNEKNDYYGYLYGGGDAFHRAERDDGSSASSHIIIHPSLFFDKEEIFSCVYLKSRWTMLYLRDQSYFLYPCTMVLHMLTFMIPSS